MSPDTEVELRCDEVAGALGTLASMDRQAERGEVPPPKTREGRNWQGRREGLRLMVTQNLQRLERLTPFLEADLREPRPADEEGRYAARLTVLLERATVLRQEAMSLQAEA